MSARWTMKEYRNARERQRRTPEKRTLAMPHAYRIIAIDLDAFGRWMRYASSWHRTIGEALQVMEERQQEGFSTVSLVPGER